MNYTLFVTSICKATQNSRTVPIAVPERGSGPRKTGCPSPKKGRRTTVISPRAPFLVAGLPPETLCRSGFSPLPAPCFPGGSLLPSTSLFPGCGFPSQCFLRHRIPPCGIRFPGHPFPDTIFPRPAFRAHYQFLRRSRVRGNSVMRSVVQP